MDVNIILNNILDKQVILKDFFWSSGMLFINLEKSNSIFTINGTPNSLNEKYYPLLFMHNQYLPVSLDIYSKILKNTYDIINYISFINNILLFPNENTYYKKSINSIIGVNDISELRKRSFTPSVGSVYDLGHFANKNGSLDSCMIVNLFFCDISVVIYILTDTFKIEINKYTPLEINLITYTYKIEDLKNFQNDYRNTIFKMYLQKELGINIKDFNFKYYGLNKILKF